MKQRKTVSLLENNILKHYTTENYGRSVSMKHKVRVTVIDKKLYPELQEQYCMDPNSGACPCYNIGDEFIFCRDDENDHFWHGGLIPL